jgi:hypothetical protein
MLGIGHFALAKCNMLLESVLVDNPNKYKHARYIHLYYNFQIVNIITSNIIKYVINILQSMLTLEMALMNNQYV